MNSPIDQSVDASIEALLILAADPISEIELAQTLEVPIEVVKQGLRRLVAFYDQTDRGFELRQVGAGWRYYTRADQADVITRFVGDQQMGRLTQASLETLAVVAYLQPVSRARIAAVRGVNADGVVRTLVARNLIQEIDRDPISGAALLGTTDFFLEKLGLTSINDLPPLAPNLPDASALDEELQRLASDGGDE